jgi:signal transduction histidine kinase
VSLRRPSSLQGRLAWRLALVLLAALALVSSMLVYYARETIDSLDDVSLQVQAAQIAQHLRREDGALRLDLPPALQQAYRGSGESDLYAVFDETGRALIASSAGAAELAAAAPAAAFEGEAFFRLPGLHAGGPSYYAMARPVAALDGIVIVVAQNQVHTDVLIDTLLGEFGEHIGWMLAASFVLTLAMGVWTIRSSLRPLNALSARAAEIGPRSAGLRLPIEEVPGEIRALVIAVNHALERLDRGFEAQRRFTASAAHELRTPLAVLTARLDALWPEAAAALLPDVQRMNRIVEQLLRVARLDSEALDLSQKVDLRQVAISTVEYMAALAIRRGRSLALAAPEDPVWVRGDAAALGDALRNLVENAIQHAPLGSEIEVLLAADGRLTVRDCGPGLSGEERELAFRRFWRGRGAKGGGAGLGLTIVAETARAHGGDVTAAANDLGGSDFTLRIPLAA